MRCMINARSVIVGLASMTVLMAMAQTQREREVLSVQGYEGQANVIRYEGRVFVDAEDLARITDGSLSIEKKRIVLTLPGPDGSFSTDEVHTPSFSRTFMKAAIEAMASIREWGGMLMVTVQDGYPVGNGMAGNTISAYEQRAADNVALASASALTISDTNGLELLHNEFNNVQVWSDKFVEARNSLSAANLTVSEGGLKHDEAAQKILHCGQFLAQMFASGDFRDDAVCH